MSRKFPSHIEGLLKYVSRPEEKANEDLALAYFRKLYPDTFTRQSEAKRSDGYVPSHFVLELKGKTNDWLCGLFQGLAYKRELDFSLIVVAAKQFLAVWQVNDLPEEAIQEVLSSKKAASTLGKDLARKYSTEKKSLYKKAIWTGGDELFGDLFSSQSDIVFTKLKSFEDTLRKAKKVRQKITPRNFITILKQMPQFFDPAQPIKAVRAFYSMVFGWNETSVLQISQRVDDQATLGGEKIENLISSKRLLFKEFVENHAVQLGEGENNDDFFAHYDEALDAVDKNFRIGHGIFFTDLDLSKFVMWLVKQHLPDLGKNYLVIDPACGSGNLVTNWRSPLELRHKVVSEIEPELLFSVEQRMKGDAWHNGKFTVVPKVNENKGLNFLDKSADDYLEILKRYLIEKGHKPNKPLAFLCNPPYRSDDDQTAEAIKYNIHPSIVELTGNDASSERYCCFLAQMKQICKIAEESGLPGDSLLLVFTKAAWMTKRPIFQKLRGEVLASFKDIDGILINGKEFFDVKGKFPVAFTIWAYNTNREMLDPERNISLIDLTWVKKDQLANLSWTDIKALDDQCKTILSNPRSIRVGLGIERQTIREWVEQKMTDFKRDRRRNEVGLTIVGGLPLGDPRMENKKAYGDSLGGKIGFMDDLTPCRINKESFNVPHFHLDVRFMRVRAYRCFSGHADNRSFAANSMEEAKKLFLWFSLGKTFAHCSYPLWVDALEIWTPIIPQRFSNEVLKYSFAIGFSENECVETIFPANNPVNGAPEIIVSNPMAPTSPESFWSKNMAQVFSESKSTPDKLVQSVENLYSVWKNNFHGRPEIIAPFKRPYFITKGALRVTAGIVQIKDYANETDDKALLGVYEDVQKLLKQTKEEFYNLLLDKNGLNYFGMQQPKKIVSLFTPSTKFEKILEKRLVVAGLIINSLSNDPNFGRTKFAKLFYLADATQNIDLRTDYYREAAGPLDARALYNSKMGIEALGMSYDYFQVKQTSGRRVKYLPGDHLPDLVERAKSLLNEKVPEINRITEICRKLDTDQCEIVATLYACWNDLLIEEKRAEDQDIIREFLQNWHHKKRRFPKDRLLKALGWMRRHNLIPNGRGKHTTAKQAVEDDAF
ncbi:hypothetical protein FBR05_00690 [Deltaproteobacteria bacterium PRO3]|nr:hypothetical protein [Deltaproteobacteria bacterium PRO3]